MAAYTKILIGFVIGAGLGLAAHSFAADAPWLRGLVDNCTYPAGQIFLRLLIMLVVPIVFSALVMGVCELDLKHLGRMGVKALLYTIVVSACAVGIGLVLVNAFTPGAGMPAVSQEVLKQGAALKTSASSSDTSAVTLIIQLVPDNVIKAAAGGDMIGLIVFSLLFGIALALTQTDGARTLKDTIAGVFDVAMRLIEGVLKLAPIGIAALMFTMTSRLGFTVLRQLGAYVLVVVAGLAIHMLVVYSLTVWTLGHMKPWAFFRSVRAAMATAFATASSNATLPTALRVAHEELRLPEHVSRFVLTAGSTLNQNGTALFEGVTVLFLAQVYGIELSLAQQAYVMGICILAGIGTAGVPAGSLPVIIMILDKLKIPGESIGLILGVDRFLDMCRTVLNVTGDLAAAVCVAGRERLAPGTLEQETATPGH